jgi:hypothetical protein
MTEFFSTYGLWIALAGVFVAMHWFGMGCCGHSRQRQGSNPTEGAADVHASAGGESTATGEMPVRLANRGCHGAVDCRV